MKRKILLLGNPILRNKCNFVNDFNNHQLKNEITDLKDTLEDFRRENDFGRGIAAIQIGIQKQIIALNLGKGTFIIINPKITAASEEMFTLWDDCMSFPDLLVRVKRHKAISIEYQNENGEKVKWENLNQAESELLQHEIDHLNGILAIDRKLEDTDIIYRSEFIKNKSFFEAKVDYTILPT